LTGPVIGGVTSGVGGVLGLPVAGTAGTIVNGPTLTWSRYLGGSGADEGTAVALDPSGNVYVAGDTAPPLAGTTGDFSTPAASDPPTATTRAYSTTAPAGTCPTGPCADAFVAKLSNTSSNSQTNGQVVYASRVGGGGDDRAAALAVDTAGHAYVVGSTSSADYPLIGSLQGFAGTATGAVTTTMAFVTKLNIQGSALWYSSYLGGSGGDAGSAVAVDGIGDVALAGTTGSADFLSLRPVARQELATQPTQTHLNGSQGQPDAFVATIDATTRYLTYGYDNVDRLTGVTETLGNAYGYAYDPAGNRTDQYLNGVDIQHSQYDNANEAITVTSPTSTTIDSYDAAGNLTADGTNSYRYDPLNRLIALTPSGPTGATGQPSQPERYTYNGDGTLVAQSVGVQGSVITTTRYTQDLAIQPSAPGANGGPSTGLFAPTGHTPPPSQVLQARVTQTSGGDLVTDYAYGVDTGGNPARFASNPLGGGAHTWYVADPQGSPRYTQDDSGQPTGVGTPSGTLNYDPQPVRYAPYGAIDLGADGTGQAPQTFGYRGELQDANTGLVNLRARTYNPVTGQFLTRDPLEQQTGQAYAYANGNPVNNTDPTGQDSAYVQGYVQASNVLYENSGAFSDSHQYNQVQIDIRRTIADSFIAADTTHQSYKGVSVENRPYAFNDPSVPHADLASFSLFRNLQGQRVGEIYDILPDYFVNNDAQGNQPNTPGADCSSAFVGILRPFTCVYKPYQDSLLALAAAAVSPRNDNLFLTSDVSQRVTPTTPSLAGVLCGPNNKGPILYLGVDYPGALGLRTLAPYTGPTVSQPMNDPTQAPLYTPGGGVPPVISGKHFFVDGYLIFTRLLAPGIVGYSACRPAQPGDAGNARLCEFPGFGVSTGSGCAFADQGAASALCVLDIVLGGSLTDFANCPPSEQGGDQCRQLALIGVVAGAIPLAKGIGKALDAVFVPSELEGASAANIASRLDPRAVVRVSRGSVGVDGAGGFHASAAGRVSAFLTADEGRVVLRAVTDCAECFPAGTLVATPHGEISIEKLRKGDLVLSEDTKSDRVEAEPVRAIIVRPMSSLMAIDLSDGSMIVVQPDHPFWVDGGQGLHERGWLLARQLRPGDRLRTAKGKDIVIARVRRAVGRAVVYTLTVAHDHTFFVGHAQVLVHNSGVVCGAFKLGSLPLRGEAFGLPDSVAPALAARGVYAAQESFSYYSKVENAFWSKYALEYARDYGWKDQRIPFIKQGVIEQRRVISPLSFAVDEAGSAVAVNDFGVDGVIGLDPAAKAVLRARIIESIRQAVGGKRILLLAMNSEHAEQEMLRYIDALGGIGGDTGPRIMGVSNITGVCNNGPCRTFFSGQVSGARPVFVYHFGS